MECEVCGKERPGLIEKDFDGVLLLACSDCRGSKGMEEEIAFIQQVPQEKVHGKKLSDVSQRQDLAQFSLEKGWGEKIRHAREKKQLTLKELGEKVFEKESIIQKIESGKFSPSRKLAEKLEALLGIKLIEEIDEEDSFGKQKKNESIEENRGFTLEDFIKKKKN